MTKYIKRFYKAVMSILHSMGLGHEPGDTNPIDLDLL